MKIRKFNENKTNYLTVEELCDIFTPITDDGSDDSEIELSSLYIEDASYQFNLLRGIHYASDIKIKDKRFNECKVLLDYSFVRDIEEEQNWVEENTTIDQYIKFNEKFTKTFKFLESELQRNGYLITIESLFRINYVAILNIKKI